MTVLAILAGLIGGKRFESWGVFFPVFVTGVSAPRAGGIPIPSDLAMG